MITFANSLDTDLDPNCLTLSGIPERFFLKMLFESSTRVNHDHTLSVVGA